MNRLLLRLLKFKLLIGALLLADISATAAIHIIRVRDSSSQFVPQYDGPILVGDTVQWLPFGPAIMTHTITSTDIPANAASFNYLWLPPTDTSFQYVATEVGTYNYYCVPHAAAGMNGTFTVEFAMDITPIEDIGIRLYPNPVGDRIYMDESYSFEEYRIYSLDGQLKQAGNQASNQILVDQLSRGIYLIELTGTRRRLQKFVKN